MAELQKLLEANGAFQSELIRDLLRQAQQSIGEYRLTDASSSTSQPIISSPSLPPDVNQNITLSTNQSALQQTESTTRDDNLNVLSNTSFTSPGFESGTNIDNNNVTSTSIGSSLARQDGGSPSTSFRHEVTSSLSVLETATADLSISGENENDRVARILSKVQESPSETRKLLVQQVTVAIVEAHLSTTINTHANVVEANERIQHKMKEMPEAYALALNSNNLWQHFTSVMAPEVTKVIKFCTKLPGFPELSQNDKILLIKQGCFEVMVTRFCLLVDPVKEEMFDPTLQIKAPRHLVRDTPMGDFLDQFFTVASKFNPLALTDEEIGLFTAVLMLCPDREGLMNRTTITAIHQLFLQSLYLLLRQNHQDADEILRTLINIMPVVRKINEDHLKCLNMIKLKSPTEFEQKFPTLHREIFDVTC